MTVRGLGKFGVWGHASVYAPTAAAELEQLGYGALWLGGSPPAALDAVDPLLAATESLVVGASIVNIWSADAKTVAESFHRIEDRFPGRFVLGIGVGHAEHTSGYRKPYDALVEYLDVLDDAGIPKECRALAALGPRVLELARDRSAGALPYFGTPAHTRLARGILGDTALLAPEQKVVLVADPEQARAIGRPTVAFYLDLANYAANLRRIGFTDTDLGKPGSDRLVDALAVHGSAADVAAQLAAHLDAGATHVAIQPLTADGDPLATLRVLATALPF